MFRIERSVSQVGVVVSKLLVLLSLVVGATILQPSVADAGAWPGPAIGDGIGVQVKPERTGPADLRRIKEAGFSYVRYDMGWGDVEHYKRSYDWTFFDRFIGYLRNQHLKSVVILDGINPLYEQRVAMPPKEYFGQNWAYASPSTEATIRAFAAFAAAAAVRYGVNDVIWEIWNEPDMTGSWPPKPDARNFTALSNAACAAIRKAAPGAITQGPALARLPDPGDPVNTQFLATFLKMSGAHCLNAFSVHPYRARDEPPETVISDYKGKVKEYLETHLAAGEKLRPIVDSEWGYASSEVGELRQADYALRIRLSDCLAGIPLTILYEWQDSSGISDERENHFGLLDANKRQKAAGRLIAQTLPVIKDAVLIGRIDVHRADYFVVVLRQPNGKYQLLFWLGEASMGAVNPKIRVDNTLTSSTTLTVSLTPQVVDISSPHPRIMVVPFPPDSTK